MNGRAVFVLSIVMGLSSGCVAASTPTPVSTPLPSPTAIPEPPTGWLPSPIGNRNAPADVPACKDAQSLDQPIRFTWAGIEDIVQNAPETNWTYYRCGQSRATLAAFYRQWLPEPQYHWTEYHWEERAQATLGVYFYSTSTPGVPNRWLYLWFVPDKTADQVSYLVAAWSDVPKSC